MARARTTTRNPLVASCLHVLPPFGNQQTTPRGAGSRGQKWPLCQPPSAAAYGKRLLIKISGDYRQVCESCKEQKFADGDDQRQNGERLRRLADGVADFSAATAPGNQFGGEDRQRRGGIGNREVQRQARRLAPRQHERASHHRRMNHSEQRQHRAAQQEAGAAQVAAIDQLGRRRAPYERRETINPLPSRLTARSDSPTSLSLASSAGRA